MAYWYIDFVSLANVAYQIRIYGKLGNTNVGLLGGAAPITTDEDDSNDIFTTVRLQTGYVNIVDRGTDIDGNAFDWRELIPTAVTDRPVELIRGGSTLVWRGFIRPEVFQGYYIDTAQLRSYPIQSQVGVLEAFDLDVEANQSYNFGALLHKIFGKAGTWGTFYFQGVDAATPVADGWLYKSVSSDIMLNITDNEVTAQTTTQYKYNCLQMLARICSFFGWACRSHGTDVYFCAAADSDRAAMGFTPLDMTDLQTIANGGEVQPIYTDYTNVTLTDSMYRSATNTESYVPGIRKAKVVQDVALKSSEMDMDTDVFDRLMNKKIDSSYSYEQGGIYTGLAGSLYDYLQRYIPDMTNTEEVEQGHRVMHISFPNCFLDIQIATDQGNSWIFNCVPHREDFHQGSDAGGTMHDPEHVFNWITGLRVNYNQLYAQDADTPYTTTISSRHPYTLNNGVLVISANTRVDEVNSGTHETYNGFAVMTFRIKVGDKYYTNGSWRTTKGAVSFSVGASTDVGWHTGTGAIPSNRSLRGPYPNYDGYGIIVGPTTNLSGIIELEILQIDNTSGHFQSGYQWVTLTSLSVQFLRRTDAAQYSERNQNIYEAVANTALQDEYSVEDIFTVDESNGMGTGIIVNPDNSYCDALVYSGDGGGTQEAPGQHNADTIVGFMSESKPILNVTVADGGQFSPATMVLDSVNGEKHWPMAISHDWRDATAKLKMIKIE